MKILFILVASCSLFTSELRACSCEETFTTPSEYAIARLAAENVSQMKVKDLKIIKYKPTVNEIILGLGDSKENYTDGSNCKILKAGKKGDVCEERFNGTFKVSFEENDCVVKVKVKRRKLNFSAKIESNTCK